MICQCSFLLREGIHENDGRSDEGQPLSLASTNTLLDSDPTTLLRSIQSKLARIHASRQLVPRIPQLALRILQLALTSPIACARGPRS
jgi:hypothetical protein